VWWLCVPWIFVHCLFSNISAAVHQEQQRCVFLGRKTYLISLLAVPSVNLKAMMHVAHGMASYSGNAEYSKSTPRGSAAGVWMHFALGQYGAESLAC
jgi:hypothetical protein